MAIQYFPTSQAYPLGFNLATNIATMQTALATIQVYHDIMVQMLGGADQNTAASYATVTAKFGYPDDNTSMAAFKELDYDITQLNTVLGSLNQLASRFRIG